MTSLLILKSIGSTCAALLLFSTQALASYISSAQSQENHGHSASSQTALPRTEGVDVTFSFTLDTNESKFQETRYSYSELHQEDPWFNDNAEPRKADTYTVVKLALDEIQFLAGLKEIVNTAEKKLGRYAKKMKLTGKIDLSRKSSLEPEPDLQKNRRFGIAIQKEEYTQIDNAFKKLLPDEMKWGISFDIPDPAVKGILDLGKNFSVKGKFGDEKEVKALFTIPF